MNKLSQNLFMSNFDFDYSGPLYERIEPPNSNKEEPNISNVWHEMGHVIGNLICNKLGYNPGEIIEIHLNGANGSKVSYENLFFHVEGVKTCDIDILDFYGYSNCMYIESSHEEELRAKVQNNKKDFFIYLIELYLGGLFNIYYFNQAPNFKCFKECYTDYESTSLECIEGRAGDDWTKSRKCLGYIRADLSEVIDFRNGLFYVLQEHDIFESFRNLIEETSERFNGKIIDKANLEEILLKAQAILDGIDNRFLDQLSEHVDEYLHKI